MKESPVTPKLYRALVGLSYPTTDADIAKAKRHEEVVRKEVEAGDVVSDIPPCSVPWLLEQGLIEGVTE